MPLLDREARNKYSREYVAARRAAYFADKKCRRCASTERLELHHRDPTTKVTHTVWSWSLARREAELAKCEVLCHDCHVIETTAQRRAASPAHGTIARYKSKQLPCRCELCKRANADWEHARRVEKLVEHQGVQPC